MRLVEDKIAGLHSSFASNNADSAEGGGGGSACAALGGGVVRHNHHAVHPQPHQASPSQPSVTSSPSYSIQFNPPPPHTPKSMTAGNGRLVRAVQLLVYIVLFLSFFRSSLWAFQLLGGADGGGLTGESIRERIDESTSNAIANDPAGGGGGDGAPPNSTAACECTLPAVYPFSKRPRFGAIVQPHNNRNNIHNVSTTLAGSQFIEEVIVCEDGSADKRLWQWSKELTRERHTIINSNGLGEARTVNRALRIMESDLVVFLADDKLLPLDEGWLLTMVQIFERYPQLGLLGGYVGQMFSPERKLDLVFTEVRSMGRNTQPIAYVDPELKIPFMFVECGWRWPLFARRSMLLNIGGFDVSSSRALELGSTPDCELSFNMWTRGYQVGLYNGDLVRDVSHTQIERGMIDAHASLWKTMVPPSDAHSTAEQIHEQVMSLNNDNLKRRTL